MEKKKQRILQLNTASAYLFSGLRKTIKNSL